MVWEVVVAVPLFLALLALSLYLNLLSATFQFAFGCAHNELSRVFTINRRTYKVCYGCGNEFDYSWSRMRAMKPEHRSSARSRSVIARQAKVLFMRAA